MPPMGKKKASTELRKKMPTEGRRKVTASARALTKARKARKVTNTDLNASYTDIMATPPAPSTT